MNNHLKTVILYTDGACSGNPGPGGWGVVLVYKDVSKELSGAEKMTTNNRMELTAAIEGLKAIREKCNVELYTDSAYVCNAFQNHWIDTWLKNGWKTSSKKNVENQDLWENLIYYTNIHQVSFHKVKGHSTNELNNRCDELARNAIKTLNQ